MEKITGNEPSYPTLEQDYSVVGNLIWNTVAGLTILQDFAARNMAALISKYNLKTPEDQQIVAQLSVELAKTLIAELNKDI